MLGLSAGAAEAVGNAKNGSRAGSEGYVLEVRGGGPRALWLGRVRERGRALSRGRVTSASQAGAESASAPSRLMPPQRAGTASLVSAPVHHSAAICTHPIRAPLPFLLSPTGHQEAGREPQAEAGGAGQAPQECWSAVSGER